MEHRHKSHSKSPKPTVLLVPLEFARWRRAKNWSYATQLGFEEGFISNNVEFFTIPVLQEVRSSSPASWLYYARQLCKDKKFDQVWIWLVHPQYDEAFWEWVKDIAPIRVGFLMESMEYHEQEIESNPGLRGRKELVENQMRYMTHILACDEADAERINKQGVCKTLWCPATVPERFLATSAVVRHERAVFCGAVYGQRGQWLKHHSLKDLIVPKASEDNFTEYPRLFEELNCKVMNFLQQNRMADEALLMDYLNILRNIRQECFKLWLNGLQTGCAVVNLPHLCKFYAGRVVEAMSVGRPVISWEIPNRPRNRALFENGNEILLFDKSKPEQLANHIRHIQNDPDFARQIAENALRKVGRFHTIEKRIQQVLDWIKTGKEPTFGEAGENIELRRDNRQTLLVEANVYDAKGQRHTQNKSADCRTATQSEKFSHFEFRNSTRKKSYFIKSGYRCNLDSNGSANPYLDDVPHASSYQAAVYRFAAELIKENGLTNVLDIGCGFGIKLAKYIYPVCGDITGIDFEHAIEFCRRKHNFGKWFTDNIEKPSLYLGSKFDLIISADVIEHLVNPDTLLEYIKLHSHPETNIILSTPERNIIQGKNSFGPPANKAHVREWNMAEFHKYISEYGFNILESFLVKDRDDSAVKKCQVFHCKPLYKSKDNPLVSVVMPAYNAVDYITEAIESVLIQNYRNFELVIINDGSSDNTEEVVLGFKDERIRYFRQENRGLAATHNVGIKQSKGEFIIKLDCDDIMTPDFIAKHLQEFKKHPDADLVYCDDCLIDEDSKPIKVIERPEYTDRKMLIRDLFRCGFPVVPFRTCIRRSVFDKIGFFDENLRMAEDYDMMRRFVKMGLKIQHLPGALYLRRMTPNSLSRNFTSQNAKFHFDVVRRFTNTFTCDELFPDVAWDEIAPKMRQLHAKCLTAGTYLAIGQEYVKTNATEYSRTAFDRACSELNDCLKMDPENQGLRQLLQKSNLIRARYTKAPQQIVSKRM